MITITQHNGDTKQTFTGSGATTLEALQDAVRNGHPSTQHRADDQAWLTSLVSLLDATDRAERGFTTYTRTTTPSPRKAKTMNTTTTTEPTTVVEAPAVETKKAPAKPRTRKAPAKAAEAPKKAPAKPRTTKAAAAPQKAAPVAKKALSAGARAVPTKAANRKRQAYLTEVGIDRYRQQYNAGWDAATAGQGAKKAASGTASVAWMDGFTDRTANPGQAGIAHKWAALRATTAPVAKA